MRVLKHLQEVGTVMRLPKKSYHSADSCIQYVEKDIYYFIGDIVVPEPDNGIFMRLMNYYSVYTDSRQNNLNLLT